MRGFRRDAKLRVSTAEKHFRINIERLKNADVVMFTGGDQLRLTSTFGGLVIGIVYMTVYEHFPRPDVEEIENE